ncbi:MAG TPA: iron-sulfur cluster repair di-iron protein [Puia sp.]|nr:iron-sulfur cluster repair di-iron protein [Puia sp.]
MPTIQENTLDVTLLEPRQKHPTIFSRFDQLSGGESLTIFNDHDPKPLYYQLLGERGDVFNWEYLEQGPEWWKVRITRRGSGAQSETLGQIAAKDIRKAQVFKKYGLDFCCGGKKTVVEACAEKGLDVTRVEQELQQAGKDKDARPLPYNEWDPGFLADYIVNTHHRYIRKNLPDLVAYASKVAQVHGTLHPELPAVCKLVEHINAELTAHLDIEEKILFPYIKALATGGPNLKTGELLSFGAAGNRIHRMEKEHEAVGQDLEAIRELTSNYVLPEDACASYSLLFRMLPEFEEDLHLHVHLENNILFHRTLELEERMGF